MTSLRGARAAFPLLAALAVACGGEKEPVGRVAAEPATVRLAYPQPVSLRLTWTPTKAIESETGKLFVFVHLLSGPRQVVRTFDHPFPGTWTPGKPVSYEFDLGQSMLAPPIAPGSYQLSLGLYDGARERWALEGGEAVANEEYAVATVEAPADQPPAPTFQFGPGWSAAEKTGDSQTLLRRWADQPATLAVSAAPAAGAVRLKVRTPEVNEGGGERLLLDAGYERPTVTVTSTCDGTQARLEGFGLHTVDVQVTAGQGCEVVVDPRFSVAQVDTVAPRAPAFLEELLWKPGAPAPAP